MKMITYSTLALAVFASACGAVNNGGASGDPTPTPTPGGATTIADIQKGSVPENSSVSLQGLVVTAIKVGGSGVDFWAQDVGGGAQSGMYFFDQNGNAPADIAVGDEVSVSGLYKEFYDLSEVVVESAEITNNGLTPDVDVVPLADLADPAAIEVWESCLVEVDATDLAVEAAANMYGEFPVGDGTDSINVDDLLYDASESISSGAAVDYLAGVVNYAFEEWKLLPRSATDLVSEVLPVVPVTVADLQDESLGNVPAEGALVDIENVTVVAVYESGTGSNLKRSFWVQDGSGPYSGILVFDKDKTKPVIAVGDVVTLRGVEFSEFQLSASWSGTMTEVNLKTSSVVEDVSTGATVEITPVTLAELVASPEQYESVLVSLTDASITVESLNPDGASDFGEYTITNGTDDIRVNDQIFQTRTGKTVDQALTTRVGIVDYFIDFKLEPRSAADMQ